MSAKQAVRSEMLRVFLYRPVWLPISITAALLCAALALLFVNAMRSMERLQPVHNHLERVTEAQSLTLRLQRLRVQHLVDHSPVPAQELKRIRTELATLIGDSQDEPAILEPLRQAQRLLANEDMQQDNALALVSDRLHEVLRKETQAHERVVGEARETARLEAQITAGTIISIPILGLIILYLVRNRVLRPLKNLGALMTQLGEREYATIGVTETDPMLQPLLEKYNSMVKRLSELEQQHQARQKSLETQVRSAAGALLHQQRTLANAERLAVVGELAARLAHELRNPLAGMQMALTNLQSEITEPEQSQRLGLVADELHRVTTLLNSLIDQSRYQPEGLKRVTLATAIDEVLTLARYQTPDRIHIEQDIDPELQWWLPENELRRSVLNLVLNARQAIGEHEGTVKVAGRIDGDRLVLTVEDDGPGFPDSMLETGIRPFSSTRADGTGLGLVSVRRFVDQVGGRITLHNKQPHGACVTLDLPAGGGK